eukprot:10015-Amorphochlora_amoeboformis.AAC.2
MSHAVGDGLRIQAIHFPRSKKPFPTNQTKNRCTPTNIIARDAARVMPNGRKRSTMGHHKIDRTSSCAPDKCHCECHGEGQPSL